MIREKRYEEVFRRCGVEMLVLDSPPEVISEFNPLIFCRSETETKFENFSEPPKPFVVYKGEPEELERVWNARYGGLR
jgi:hypothetical protein